MSNRAGERVAAGLQPEVGERRQPVRPPTGSLPPSRVRTLLRLQASAGNGAVTAMLRRRARPLTRNARPSTNRAVRREGTASRPAAGSKGGQPGLQAGYAATTELPAPPADERSRPFELIQRQAVADCAPPEPPTPIAPEEDPNFVAVTEKIEEKAGTAKKHPSGKAEAKKAQAAAVAPPGDKLSQAKAAQTDKMAAAKPRGFDKAAFIAAVKKAIDKASPKSLNEADKFAKSGKADGIKTEVMSKVTKGKQDSAKDVAGATKAAPDPSVAKEKPVVPLAETKATTPGSPGAGKAMPGKAPPEQTNLDAGKCDTDAAMAEEDVTEEQLAESNEPEFEGALEAKKEGEEHSASAPAEVRASEAETLAGAKEGATQAGTAAVAQMGSSKSSAFANAKSKKQATKTKDEAERAKVTTRINSIFDTTKADVERILTELDGKVEARFNAGESDAKRAFTNDHEARMRAYKRKRYKGARGLYRWGRDKWKGLPAEANNIYQQSKALYESKMGKVISDVADLIGSELDRAKARIERGRSEVKSYVASLPKNLKSVGQQAAKEVEGRFGDLESDVDSKQDELVNDLAAKYVEARDKVDEEIAAMQEANKGLWDKAKAAVKGVIDTIRKLKDMLLGVLARAAGAIKKIIKRPIEFLGNLVGAVKGGIAAFRDRIEEHLKKGLQAWLFGELAKGGVQLPQKFDLKGILQLVVSLLGLTYANIRNRAVKIVGENVVKRMEQAVEVFKILVTEGPAGLWKLIVDKIAALKEQVMSEIKQFVITKVIIAGVKWLVSLLNPAAAFIKACKAIYDIIMFFVNKASQIKAFVDSVLDSVEAIAAGGAGRVSGLIENTLAKMLPLVIGFLASLLGLGGISAKIKQVIQKIQAPINRAIDGLIKGAIKQGKRLFAKAKSLFSKKPDALKKSSKEKRQADQAKREAVEEVTKRARGLERIDALTPIVSSVRSKYQPKGLDGLSVTADDSATSVTVIARQTEQPERRTMTWAEVFPAVDLTQLEQMLQGDLKAFEKQGRSTVAVLSVNGAPLGRVEESGEGTHAEMKVFANNWEQAVEIARPRAQRGERTSVVVAVNRSPCPDCARRLRAITQAARSKWPDVGPFIDFTLAATGTYEGSDPTSMEGATKASDLARLAGLGWDIRQLVTGVKQYEVRAVPLAEFAHKLAVKAKRAGR